MTDLTSREQQIAEMIAEGTSYKVIAGELCIALSTVRNTVCNIYRKLEINNRVQLAKIILGVQDLKPKRVCPRCGQDLPQAVAS